MSNNFLFQKSYNLLDNVDKYFRNRQATDDNMAHALYMLDTQGCKHTLGIRNTYCFLTATMVARKRLNIMLYVHCMSSFSNHCCNMTPQPNSNITHLKILGPVDKVICHSLPICSVTQQSTHFVKSSHKLGQDNFSHLYPAS